MSLSSSMSWSPRACSKRVARRPAAAVASVRLREYEATPAGQAAAAALEPFQALFLRLLVTDLQELELASMLVLEWQRGEGWLRATETTRFFKGEPANSSQLQRALELARAVVQQAA